jgi:hypothetical protein
MSGASRDRRGSRAARPDSGGAGEKGRGRAPGARNKPKERVRRSRRPWRPRKPRQPQPDAERSLGPGTCQRTRQREPRRPRYQPRKDGGALAQRKRVPEGHARTKLPRQWRIEGDASRKQTKEPLSHRTGEEGAWQAAHQPCTTERGGAGTRRHQKYGRPKPPYAPRGRSGGSGCPRSRAGSRSTGRCHRKVPCMLGRDRGGQPAMVRTFLLQLQAPNGSQPRSLGGARTGSQRSQGSQGSQGPRFREARWAAVDAEIEKYDRSDSKNVWPPGRACAARWPWNLPPDDVGRWTTRNPIDAAPRARFKSTRTIPQRAMPTTFGDSDSHQLRAAPPGDPRRAPLSPSVGWRGSSRPATIGGGPGRYCWQLDSDALAHLALDRHAAQAPVVQRKPGEG